MAFTFPANPFPPEDGQEHASPHPQTHDQFLAKFQHSPHILPPRPAPAPPPSTQHAYSSSVSSQSSYPTAVLSNGRPLSRVVESPTPYHLPSRSFSSPTPSNTQVPIDNFAAPRADSAMAYAPRHRRGASSLGNGGSGTIAPEGRRSSVDGESMTGESRHRFTIGDTTSEFYSRGLGMGAGKGAMGEKGKGEKASGWEMEGGRRRGNKVFLGWCVGALVVIAVAVGVGVGVGTRKSAAAADSATTSSSTTGSTSAPSASLVSTAVASSGTASELLTSSSSAAHSSALAAAKTASAPVSQTTVYAFVLSSHTTTADVTYTVPTSVETRTNGQWQFTEDVVLPNPAASGAASFTSSLRFRVEPTGTAVGRVRRGGMGRGNIGAELA